jgi:hypothetical protein
MADENSLDLAKRFYSDVKLSSELPGRASFFAWTQANQAFGYEPQYSWRDGWTSR